MITNAMDADMKNGMAILEEFLQEKYVENFDKFDENEPKVMVVQRLYPEYFYIPKNEGVGGLSYILNKDGNALYLIKKSGLPKEIKSSLVGGNAGEGKYNDYASLNDVYGVTSDLKVYYSSSSNSTLLALGNIELDIDDTTREVFKARKSFFELSKWRR